MTGGSADHRLFFALQPDRHTLKTLSLIQRRMRADAGRPVPPERLHATLLFMGNQSAATLQRLQKIASLLEFPTCRLLLDRLGHFPRAGVAWLGPSHVPVELEAFQSSLSTAVADIGVAFDERPWRMHVTLYRDLRKRPGRIRFEPVEWPLRGFQLMESIQHGAGLEYRCRGRWPAASAA